MVDVIDNYDKAHPEGVNFYKVKRLKLELIEIWEKAFNGGD